jgi:hypothetical protein
MLPLIHFDGKVTAARWLLHSTIRELAWSFPSRPNYLGLACPLTVLLEWVQILANSSWFSLRFYARLVSLSPLFRW